MFRIGYLDTENFTYWSFDNPIGNNFGFTPEPGDSNQASVFGFSGNPIGYEGLPGILRDDQLVWIEPTRAAGNDRGTNLLQADYFEFTVFTDNQTKRHRLESVEFFSDLPRNSEPWELRWSWDNYDSVIASQSSNNTVALPSYDSWTKYKAGLGPPVDEDGVRWLCHTQPVTFRIYNTAFASGWRIDNVTVAREAGNQSCLNDLEQSIDELSELVELIDTRVPVDFFLDGPGTVEVGYGPDPNPAADGQFSLIIDVAGSDPASTLIRTELHDSSGSGGLMPVVLRTDGGVFAIDLLASDTFRGQLDIGGTVRDAIYLNGLADGSGISAQATISDSLSVYAFGPLGENVTVTTGGELSTLHVDGGWAGGLLAAKSLGSATIENGDFGAAVLLEHGFGTFDVLGGDFASPNFRTGTALPARSLGAPGGRAPLRGADGSGGAIRASAVGGVGGSIHGHITLNGGLDELAATGGSIDATVTAFGPVKRVYAAIGVDTGVGGDIGGAMRLDSLDKLTSIGGTITTSLTTFDPDHVTMEVDGVEYQGHGGTIDSPNSFLIAGGIARISGNDINLRVEAGREIGLIVVLPRGGGQPSSLRGRFTANAFGDITVREGVVDVSMTSTGEAWSLDGKSAFKTLSVPAGRWMAENLNLNLGARPGQITVAGQRLDLLDPDGLIIEDGLRLEPLWDGFAFTMYVVPASWQNFRSHFDVNDDHFVTPLDVLRIINDINRFGARPLTRPSVKTSVPPN